MLRPIKLTRTRLNHAISFALGLLASSPVNANPQGMQVVTGTVGVAMPNQQTLEISNSPGAILNWQGFDIGAGEITRFIQQDTASAVLNRVTTQNSSEIFGQLLSNGHVFLINSAGILIGRDAVVDTAGLVLSTLNISNADFTAGRYKFAGDGASGTITNHGYIKSAPGGEIVLIAPKILNSPEAGNPKSGVIESPNGDLVLAAGYALTISSLDDPDVSFEVQAPENEAINLGQLLAKGGTASVLAGTIRHSGEINADSVGVNAAGRVVLRASSKVELASHSVTSASAADGAGGEIEVSAGAGRVYQMGAIRADGATGGKVTVTAERVLSTGPISAKGTGAGGTIAVTAREEIIASSESSADASGGTGAGGTVKFDGGKGVFSSGRLRATGQTGGTIQVLAEDIALANAKLDASGASAGGNIRVGGGFQGGEGLTRAKVVDINPSTTMNVSARERGHGGSAVVWSDGTTRYQGTILAKGGAEFGDGGSVEVSGKEALGFDGRVDVTAAHGFAGSLLLDPKTLRFVNSTGSIATTSLLDPHPGTNNHFGASTQLLFEIDVVGSSAPVKILVFDPLDDFGGTDAGAVYMFRLSDGALLSALTGSQAGDLVGNTGFIQHEFSTDINFLRSPSWGGSAGAITAFDLINGTSGAVSAVNSLVGANADNPATVGINEGDQLGSGGIFSPDGIQIQINSPDFDGDRGALTIRNPGNLVGVVGATNSLIGAVAGDRLTSFSFEQFFGSGKSVIRSSNGGRGAVTFFDLNAPTVGVISASNSLVGALITDGIGNNGIVNFGAKYGVFSPNFSSNAGALTFGSTATGLVGTVSVSNSLVGGFGGDSFSSGSQTALGGGRFALRSLNGGFGAVTFIDPNAPTVGFISASNSLVGTARTEPIGSGGVVNYGTNYGVFSPEFNNTAGALTFGSTATGLVGTVSASNSLVGAFIRDLFSSGSQTALGGGRFLLQSTHGGSGAITFVDPNAPIVGVVDAANSLVGPSPTANLGASSIQLLTGSIFAIRSSGWDAAAGDTNEGAVTFFDAASGTFAGTANPFVGVVSAVNSLVGVTAGDFIGSGGTRFVTDNGITQTFGVFSPNFDNGAASNAGAVTWWSPGDNLTGAVGVGNSLVGGFTNDGLGSNVFDALQGFGANGVFFVFLNGNALLRTPGFNSAAGAVTFLPVAGPRVVGVLGSGNSLVGSTANDQVGSGGILITAGQYAVLSPFWNDVNAPNAGAVTIASKASGISGAISSTNSIVGSSTTGDFVGSGGIRILNNGNGLLISPSFNGNRGAITFLDFVNNHLFGAAPGNFAAVISATNSLVGGTANDNIGSGGISALSSGNYVVLSPDFDTLSGISNVGAVTFGVGVTGVAGIVSNTNSLTGSQLNDRVGEFTPGTSDSVFQLSNGQVLIRSQAWNSSAGAVTFLDQFTGRFGGASGVLAGDLGVGNSLIGGTPNDSLGSDGIGEFVAGANHYYAVFSPLFDNGATDTGAVTFANANTGAFGFVSSANSVVGTFANDRIGFNAGFQSLSNGNIVLLNQQWNARRGAATFLDLVNNLELQGDISVLNSVLGSTPESRPGSGDGDEVGSNGILELFGTGVFAVLSPNWNLTAAGNFNGAISWGNVATGFGVRGAVSASNSLFGSFSGDGVGTSFNFNFDQVAGTSLRFVRTPNWNSGAGAITFFDPSVATPFGAITDSNSLVGSTAGDALGRDGISAVFTTAGTKVLVESSLWDNGAATDAGAITAFLASSPISGFVSATNSLVGSNTNDRVGGGFVEFFNNGNRAFVTTSWNQNRGAFTFWNPANALVGTIDSTNSLIGATAGDQIGSFGAREIGTDRFFLQNPGWNNDMGALTFGSTVTGITGEVSAANSFVGSVSGDRIGGNVNFLSFSTRLMVRSPTWNNSAGMVAFIDPNAPPIGVVSAANSLIGTNSDNLATLNVNEGDQIGGNLRQLFTIDNRGLVVLQSRFWNNNSGAVTVVDTNAPIVGVVSELNSLVGRAGDQVGEGIDGAPTIDELSNGALLIFSHQWSDGTDQRFGAVTYMAKAGAGSPVTPVTGFVSAANSLVGSHLDDGVGSGGRHGLESGNIVIRSPNWNANRGALTFMDIKTGLVGVVSPENSFTGEAPKDLIGSGGIDSLGGNKFIVYSPDALFNGVVGAGRIDIVDGGTVQAVTGDVGFSLNPAGELLISVQSVINFLNGGGTLNLQANNDIFLPFGADLFADAGSITFRAGRSIQIESNLVLLNGALTLIANDKGGDLNFRESGDGNVTLQAGTSPVRVQARTLRVDAQNVFVNGGTGTGAYAALIGTDLAEIVAHGSGLIELVGGNDPAAILGEIRSTNEVFTQFLENPSSLTSAAAFILGGSKLQIHADTINLLGGASAGAFAALVSFGEFRVESIDITLTPGVGANADALFVALGGVPDLKFETCTGCGDQSLLSDPFLDPESNSGIFISGLLEEPSVNAILSMLDRTGDRDDDGDDDDDDDDDDTKECGL